MFKALVYAYVLGGLTFVPLLVGLVIFITVYTSVPVGDPDMAKKERKRLQQESFGEEEEDAQKEKDITSDPPETNDFPTTRKAWLTMRRTFEETEDNTSYVTLVRSFLDSRSKDPRRSRPKDMWFVVLKRNILYLYEDEGMTECGAVIELSRHDVLIYPEGLPDAELFTRRNAICLRQKPSASPNLASFTREMKHSDEVELKLEKSNSTGSKRERERDALVEEEKRKDAARDEAFDPTTPWFIFVRSPHEMEDWYFALLHAATNAPHTRTLHPLAAVFDPKDMNHLVSTLDDQPDVIPMRWLNALLGRIFFSHYRTHNLEAYIIGRLMKKIEKVKRPQFLTSIAVTEVSVGNRPPMLSKPMLKELTKEGDASLEVHFQYKGEIRITVEATAVINLSARFKSYTVKLVLAVVLKELEGNLLVKVKRPPSNRIWYAFTQMPRMVLEVEPIVSDRQITWGMILSTIESKIKEVLQESVVLPNMDDIAYFDSIPFQFRGGIWSDASRHTHPRSFQPVPPEMTDDTVSAASAPVATTTEQGAEPPSMQTSRSEDALPVKASSSSSSRDNSKPRVVVDDPTDSDRNNTRRKTWFSAVRSEGSNGPASLSVPDLFEEPVDDTTTEPTRGRTGNSDDISERQRSRSRPRSSHSTRSNKSSGDQDIASIVTQSLRRSLSRQSNRDDVPSGTNDLTSNTRQGQSKSNPATPQRKASSSSQQKRSPSPPSFFSTLKSKAGDKQALSNTAKEAMRKWGVNWGGKRDSAGGSGSEDSNNDTASSSRLTVGGSSSQGHKPRASYAEVRAAVAERREREKQAETSTSRPTSPLPPSDRLLAPQPADSSTSNETTLNPSIVAAAARLANPRISTKKSTPSMSRVNTDIDAEPDTGPETLIHVQPKAKVMSIPGIHASHRGEIQAMGYVAPQPAPPPPTTLESRLKNPAIQTVYRFWRKGSISNSSLDQAGESTSSTQTDDQPTPQLPSSSSPPSQDANLDEDKEDDKDAVSNSQLESQPTRGRPTPPPLPPRTSLASGGSTSTHSSISQGPPHLTDLASHPATPPPALSPASAALKDIVSKDENTRNQLLSQEQPNLQHAAGSVSEEETASEKPGPPPAVGALNASTTQSSLASQSSGNTSGGESNLSNVTRTPPPLPPRRHSVQAAAG